jgi:hypothetical protein
MVLDEVIGEGRHTMESLVHFVPNAICRVDAEHVEVSTDSAEMRLYPYRDHSVSACGMTCTRGQNNPIQGWYASRFGERTPNEVLSFSSDLSLPARIGYLIAPASREITSWDAQLSDIGKPIHAEISLSSPQGDLFERFDVRIATSVESIREPGDRDSQG